MATFGAQTDTMHGGASSIATTVTTIDGELTTLAGNIKALAESWTGEGSVEFQELYTTFETRRVQLQETLHGISQALTGAATAYEETEAAVANAFRGA